MHRKNFIIMIFIIFFLTPDLSKAIELQIVTEQYPPYNYQENGTIKGIGTEVVRAVLKEAGINGKIKVYPLARALMMATEEKNTLIYCISRTENREKVFTWIGVIAPIDFYFYSLKKRTDIKINSLNDAKKYRTGIVFKDALDEFFVYHNFTKLDRVYKNNLNLKKLMIERIDIWPISELTANYIIKKNGYNPEETVKKDFKIHEFTRDQYLAISKMTSLKIKDKIRNGLIRIKQKGIYKKILSKYK